MPTGYCTLKHHDVYAGRAATPRFVSEEVLAETETPEGWEEREPLPKALLSPPSDVAPCAVSLTMILLINIHGNVAGCAVSLSADGLPRQL